MPQLIYMKGKMWEDGGFHGYIYTMLTWDRWMDRLLQPTEISIYRNDIMLIIPLNLAPLLSRTTALG